MKGEEPDQHHLHLSPMSNIIELLLLLIVKLNWIVDVTAAPTIYKQVCSK